MDFEIIDFHTHPFLLPDANICAHADRCIMNAEETKKTMQELGVSYFAGSVIRQRLKEGETQLQKMIKNNNEALTLKEMYGGMYIPGFHVNPLYVKESCEEIERMHALGVNLIGELVPYMDGWEDYSSKEFYEILDLAEKYDMVVSLHTMGEDNMDKMVKSHPRVKFVAAHPGEYPSLIRHIERAKLSENYYVDVSGTGIFRFGSLRRLVDELGADRVLFGSDFPTCNPGMFIGGVIYDRNLSDTEKEKIFAKNARALLGIASSDV